MKTSVARHISISISRSALEVYNYVSDPRNLPNWASGLANGTLSQVGETWVAESPMGKVKIKFAPKNIFGVVDHDVTLDSGITVHNPMRVLENGDGSEVVFTLYRQPDMTDEKFAEDASWVEKDLKKLKALLD